MQPFLSVPSDADKLLHKAPPDAGYTREDILVGAQTRVGIIPVRCLYDTLLQIRASLFGRQERSNVLLFDKMHARLHPIDRAKIKSRLGGLRCRKLFGQLAGVLRGLLEFREQRGPLVRIGRHQTPLPVGSGTIKISRRVRRREVNEVLGSAQRLVKLHVINQVQGVLRRLKQCGMRHDPTVRRYAKQDGK